MPITPFRPKEPNLIRQYHLAQVKLGLTMPDSRIGRYVVRWNLEALNVATGHNDTLKSIAIRTLREFGLDIPDNICIPEEIIADWETSKDRRNKKAIRETIPFKPNWM